MLPYEAKGYTKYGAQMGRGLRNQFPIHEAGKVHLRRVRLDTGGYDVGGAYWGQGEPLWCAWNDAGEFYFRAPDRATAKLNPQVSGAKFYR